MNSKLTILILVVAGLLLAANSTLFVVSETERAVLLRFGEVVDEDIPPGLHVKIPFVQNVRKFDARIQILDADIESYFTSERKRLMVDSYAKWRIDDIATFYRSTGGNEAMAQSRLSSRINSGLRNQFGTRTLNDVVSGERDQLMMDILNDLNVNVGTALGIEVIDVRVKRIDLPSEVEGQVYRRMTAEREKEARDWRARGLEQAERIRADADRQRVVIESDAYREAEETRGLGDAEATAIYAEAYNKDSEFYAFTRSLRAYRDSFTSKGDIMLVDPENDFFRYLNNQGGGN